jgi:hypothetical protein
MKRLEEKQVLKNNEVGKSKNDFEVFRLEARREVFV